MNAFALQFITGIFFWLIKNLHRTSLTYHFLNVLISSGQTVSIMKKWENICIIIQIFAVGSTAMIVDSIFPMRIPQNITQDNSFSDETMTADFQYLA